MILYDIMILMVQKLGTVANINITVLKHHSILTGN